jgi:hypothetical protein
MNIKDWLHASPDHDVILRAEPGGAIRAVLRGERPDGRWIGVGADEDKAIKQALEIRDKIKTARP